LKLGIQKIFVDYANANMQSDFENFQNPQTIFKKIWNFVILEDRREMMYRKRGKG